MVSRAARLMLRDELVGFAKSKVMLVLWVVLPVLATLGYFVLPSPTEGGAKRTDMPLTYLMGLFISSLAGTIAAVMVAVDIVSERSRKVYELFIIRPIRHETIIWAKFVAVFLSVTVASVLALAVGIAVDLVRGVALSPELLEETLKSFGSVMGVIAISTSVGIFFGVMSRSILVAVILILYVGQNLAIIPMLPAFLGLGGSAYWIIQGVTVITTLAVMCLAGYLFRRAEY